MGEKVAAGRMRGPRAGRSGRTGFTLVEMLVSVTLVLLMMTLFAEIFQMATGSISTQRGIAELDQRSRTCFTVMRGDLDKRTFWNVVPYGIDPVTNDPETTVEGVPSRLEESPISFGNRHGYFYISENDTGNDTDDVLQLTVSSLVKRKDADDTPYFGKALELVPAPQRPRQTRHSTF